eukprot:scaffold9530_cov222-Alexandrium_tamarense.AAC.8
MDDFNRPSRTFRPREMANTHQQQIRNPDIICDACGGKGHPASQCWPLAKELLLTNFIIRIVTDNRKEGFAKKFGTPRKMTGRQLANDLDY